MDADPRFHLDALRWFACLTEVAGVAPTDLVIHHVGDGSFDVLDQLSARGVTVRSVQAFDKRSPHCNKISGALALAEIPLEGVAVLCDTDVAILEDPRRLGVPQDRVAGKTVDAPVPSYEVLLRIFAAAELDAPPAAPLPWGPQERTVTGNMNGGLYVIPGSLLGRLASAWGRWAEWLLDRAELLDQWTVHVDQVAMALALGAEGIGSFPLDVRWNTPTHDSTRIPPRPQSPVVLHYHQKVNDRGRILPTGNPTIDGQIAVANDAIGRVWDQVQPDTTMVRWNAERGTDQDPTRCGEPASLVRPYGDLTAIVGLLAAVVQQPSSVLEVGLPGSRPLVHLDGITFVAMEPSDLITGGEGVVLDAGLEADLVVCHQAWVQAASPDEPDAIATVWASARHGLVLAGPARTDLHGALRTLKGSLEADDAGIELYPVATEEGWAVIALRPPGTRHPRDFGPTSLAPLIDRHPDPARLATLHLHAWRTTTFYPDHAPRLWEYPVVFDLLVDRLGPGSRLVDVGAGVTPLPPYLTLQGFMVDTVDPAENVRGWPPQADWNEWDYLDYGQRGLAHRSWNSTLDRLPRRRSFDGALSVSVIEHLPASDRRDLLAELANRVRIDGWVILTVDLVRGCDSLWNRSRGLVVEDPAVHGDFDDLVAECRAVGLDLVHQEKVRQWGEGEVDIGLLVLHRAGSHSGTGWSRLTQRARASVRNRPPG